MSGGRPPGIQFDRLPTLWDSLLAEGEQFVGNGARRWRRVTTLGNRSCGPLTR